MKKGTKKSGWGGARPGSGPKTNTPAVKTITFRAEADIVEFLEKYPRQTRAIITKALRRYRDEFNVPEGGRPKEFRTGLINPSTGKEWILSDYYVDDSDNKHFTHEEAMEIWKSVPGWGPCTDEFHRALADAVWDDDQWEWRENVLGSGLNGFEYMTKRLGYELGGLRDKEDSMLYGVGYGGYSWSCTPVTDDVAVRYLDFGTQSLYPSSAHNRGHGFLVRFLR